MHLGFLTLDIIILLVIGIALFSWSLYSGKKVLARFILIFYPTTLIFQNIPYVDLKGDIAKILVYIGLYVGLFYLLRKNTTAKKLYSGGRKAFDGILLTLGGLIILLTVYYHLLPVNVFYDFTIPFSDLFTNKIPVGIWYLAPLLTIVLTNKSDE